MPKMHAVEATSPAEHHDWRTARPHGLAFGNLHRFRGLLAFSALTGVCPMTEVYPLERAAEAYERMMSNKVRFRVVLTTSN
jgi:D-arabinose 1-dehydrogenase-like Zn-dependent alcohol dehydrogenase